MSVWTVGFAGSAGASCQLQRRHCTGVSDGVYHTGYFNINYGILIPLCHRCNVSAEVRTLSVHDMIDRGTKPNIELTILHCCLQEPL